MIGSFRPGTSSVVYGPQEDEPGVVELYVNDLATQRSGHRRRR